MELLDLMKVKSGVNHIESAYKKNVYLRTYRETQQANSCVSEIATRKQQTAGKAR